MKLRPVLSSAVESQLCSVTPTFGGFSRMGSAVGSLQLTRCEGMGKLYISECLRESFNTTKRDCQVSVDGENAL